MAKKIDNTPRGTSKILIVEDDEDFLSILKTKFVSEGFSVATAEDGEGGGIAAEKEKPDLILSDVLIPKIDGIAMAKKLREAKNNAPIIFLTNIKDDSYINEIKKIDNADYIIKSESSINNIVEKTKIKLGI